MSSPGAGGSGAGSAGGSGGQDEAPAKKPKVTGRRGSRRRPLLRSCWCLVQERKTVDGWAEHALNIAGEFGDVLKTAAKLQKKIHPDMNRDVNSERLSQIVNEAKEKIIKTDFS